VSAAADFLAPMQGQQKASGLESTFLI
jgi:hypothetical protein